MVKAIYTNRHFAVREAGKTSGQREQQAGICQGCPLSPFLFASLMTVLLRDAKASLGDAAGDVSDLVYADDTLIIAPGAAEAELYMKAISDAGANYGLKYNWRKLELMATGCNASAILKPDGCPIPEKKSMVYLGGVLTSDGSVGAELSRRVGLARSVFDSLQRVWSHSSLSTKRKLTIYAACVESTLLYSLHTSWLRQHELSRLNAFQARCLRRIPGIKHSYISRVTNATVLQRAGRGKLSDLLLQRQLVLFGEIARKADDHPVRKAVFQPSSSELAQAPGRRKRGRPRQAWATELSKHAKQVCRDYGWSFSNLGTFLAEAWKAAVRKYTV